MKNNLALPQSAPLPNLKLRPLTIAITGALIISSAVYAEETALDSIIVKATRHTPETLSGKALKTTDLMPLRSSTSDTASLLKNIPGVEIYSAGGVSSLPVMHGLADDRLRIKLDGMDLISSCPNHMNSPLSYIDPTALGRLKVYPGITPVSVGGDSIGGTIIAETAAPEFARPGTTLLKGEIGAFYRSNGNAKGGNASVAYANEMLSVTYTGSTTKADNYDAGGKFKNAGIAAAGRGYLAGDEVGSTAYKSENHTLGVALNRENHLFELKFGFQNIPHEGFPNQRMDLLDNTAHRLNLRHLGQFGWGTLEARIYHETVKHAMNFGDDKQFWYGTPATIPGMPMQTESKNTGAVVKASIDLSKQDLLRIGSEYQHYRLDDWWPPSGGTMMGPNTFWNINNGQRDRTALFGEWESRVHQTWMTLLGARYERVKMEAGNVRGYGGMMYIDDANAFNAQNRKKTDGNWDMTALAQYTPNAMHAIEFGYAQKTRSPNLYERFAWSKTGMVMQMVNAAGDGNGYVGDPNLKPEKAHTLSATLDWHAADRHWEFKATPYYTRVTDYIDVTRCFGSGAVCGGTSNNTAANQFVYLQFANQKARLYGVDLSGHMPLAKTEGWGSFTLAGIVNYVNGKNRTTGDDLYNIMPMNGRFSLSQTLGAWVNTAELQLVKAKTDVSYVRNEIRTPGYGLLNLRSSYTWKQARIDIGMDNVFNRFYFLPLGGAYVGQGKTMSGTAVPWGIAVPGMGRSVYTGLTYAF